MMRFLIVLLAITTMFHTTAHQVEDADLLEFLKQTKRDDTAKIIVSEVERDKPRVCKYFGMIRICSSVWPETLAGHEHPPPPPPPENWRSYGQPVDETSS